MEAKTDGQTASPPSGVVPIFDPAKTLSPTATERLLEAGGANVYVLSKDPDLFAAIKIAAGNRVPVHVIWSLGELRRHAERGDCKIVLLDADLFEGDLRSWIEELSALEPTLVMLVAAPRSAEDRLTELLSERLVYRLLTKPAEVPIARTLLDVAVSRYLQRCGEVMASVTAIDSARDDVAPRGSDIPADNDIPVPRNELIALRAAAAAHTVTITMERRKLPVPAKTYWPAWLLPVGLVVALAVAAFLADFPALDFRGRFGESASAPQEPSFAEPVVAETAPVDSVVGRSEDVFLPDETAETSPEEAEGSPPAAEASPPATEASPDVAEAPPDAPSEALAPIVIAEIAPASTPRAADDTSALAPVFTEPPAGSPSAVGPPAEELSALEPLAVEPPAVEPPASARAAPEPAAAPAATVSPELEGVLANAWARIRESALLAPPGDSARDYVARATELAPDHPDVLAIRLLLADAVAESARVALESGDLESAETLADEAFRLGASDEALALLDLDLAAAREAGTRRMHYELLRRGSARIRADQLIAPESDNALAYLSRLRAENPNYPGLDAAWQSLGAALAGKVEESAAARDWAGAEAWLEPLALVASPETVDRLRAELAVRRIDAEYLTTPAAEGELLLLTSVEPVYPQEARRRRISGWVDVELIVGTDGIPHDVRVIAAQPLATFNQAALTAVSRYRYEPFERDGHAFERLARVRISFDWRR
jgi:protein TonB